MYISLCLAFLKLCKSELATKYPALFDIAAAMLMRTVLFQGYKMLLLAVD